MSRVEKFKLWEEVQRLSVYVKSSELGEAVWAVVSRLSWLEKKSIGAQYISCVDSIGANIAEGYGRYFYKDKIKFYYYSRGSLLEACSWTKTMKNRGFLSEEEYKKITDLLSQIPIEMHVLIRNTKYQFVSKRLNT